MAGDRESAVPDLKTNVPHSARIYDYNANGIPTRARSKADVAELFRGLELADPGIPLVSQWRPDDKTPAVADAHVHMYGGIAIKRGA